MNFLKSLFVCALAFGIFVGFDAVAQTAQPVSASLQASASKQVQQDEVKLIFAHDAKGNTAAEVNRLLAEALDQAKASLKEKSGFSLTTGSFRTTQFFNKDGRADGWRGRAELILTSNNLKAAQSAAGLLGTRLALSNIQFSLSETARRKEEQTLLKEVAQAFRERAQAAAEAFGFKRYQIVNLNFSGANSLQPLPLMRSAAPMAASLATSDPIRFSFDPGVVQVSVDVEGKVNFE
jgi:predicted secreted protein